MVGSPVDGGREQQLRKECGRSTGTSCAYIALRLYNNATLDLAPWIKSLKSGKITRCLPTVLSLCKRLVLCLLSLERGDISFPLLRFSIREELTYSERKYSIYQRN